MAGRKCSLTNHVVGNMDLDLSLVLEGHLALDALVCLFLFGNQKIKDLERKEVGKRRKQKFLGGLAQDFPEWFQSPPRSPQAILFPPPSKSSSTRLGKGHEATFQGSCSSARSGKTAIPK